MIASREKDRCPTPFSGQVHSRLVQWAVVVPGAPVVGPGAPVVVPGAPVVVPGAPVVVPGAKAAAAVVGAGVGASVDLGQHNAAVSASHSSGASVVAAAP